MATNLTAEDLQAFGRLGIPPEVCERAELRRVSDLEAKNEYHLKCFGDATGILFPYPVGPNGDTATYRLRRDFPALVNGKPEMKYISPAGGDRRHGYVMRGTHAQLEDLSVPAIVCEAEKSVLAIHSWTLRHDVQKELGIPGLVAIGLGGCNGYSVTAGFKLMPDGKHEPVKGLLPELRYKRLYLLLFDTNAATNESVQASRRTLARKLREERARAFIVELPPAEGRNGPDDLLSEPNGDAVFLELLKHQFDLIRKASGPGPSRTTPETDPKPKVFIYAGEAGTAADEAETILLPHATNLHVFEQVGKVCRIVQLREPKVSCGIARPAGTVLVEIVTKAMLGEVFEHLIDFCLIDDNGEPVKTNVPGRVLDYYLARTGTRRLPVLLGTALCPYMRPDGVVVDRPGYDEETGLYLLSDETWLPVPKEPTRDEALDSLAVLREPFGEFPFDSAAAFSVHLAALLTVVQRRLLRSAPMFCYTAPVQRTGKSVLATSVAIIGTGRSAPCQTISTEGEEMRKMVYSVLSEGHPIYNLDNITRPLDAESLSIALTEETYSDRKLGVSNVPHVGTRMLWTATGNNLVLRGDLVVRAVVCRIDSNQENPEERTFKIANLPEYLRTHRAELVQAILIILRAYHLAGSPVQDIKPWGGYDEWTAAIRAPLVWLGQADPVDTRASIASEDPERNAAIALLDALDRTFGEDTPPTFTLAAAVKKAKEAGNESLEDALKTVAAKGVLEQRPLGYWFRKWKDRFAGGMCLREDSKQRHAVVWKIEVSKPKE